jgi:hypothetical protein
MPFIEKANQPVVWRFGYSFVKISKASRAASSGGPIVAESPHRVRGIPRLIIEALGSFPYL